ncbi:MAG: hypothetical protein KJ065_02675 [Anaerolineae bacterium]|nr:hypothetical protein [Anaerolineae bacterium]
MNITLSKPMIFGLALVVTLISGFILSNLGKPYNTVFFNIHKLVAVGMTIFVAVTVFNLFKSSGMDAIYVLVFAITGLLFVTLIVTGGLLSVVAGTDVTLNAATLQIVQRVHQIAPVLALIASAVSLYVLVSARA